MTLPTADTTPRSGDRTPLSNTHFEVAFDGLPPLGFAGVEGIETALEGVPGNLTGAASGRVRERPTTLLLTRAATGSRELWEWYAQARQGRNPRRNGLITIFDADGAAILRITLRGAQPTRWRLGRLDALQPGLLTEEIGLHVEAIELS